VALIAAVGLMLQDSSELTKNLDAGIFLRGLDVSRFARKDVGVTAMDAARPVG
jgi:hypothetical protein